MEARREGRDTECTDGRKSMKVNKTRYVSLVRFGQLSRSTRSSSALTLLRHSVTSPLKVADRSIAIAVTPLWNKVPLALRQISYPAYELTKTPLLPIPPQHFHSKFKTLLFKKSYPDSSSFPYLPPFQLQTPFTTAV